MNVNLEKLPGDGGVAPPGFRYETDLLAAALGRRFEDQPQFIYMVPDAGTRRLLSPVFFQAAIRLALRRGRVSVTGDGTGVALWLSPGNAPGFAEVARAETAPPLPDLPWHVGRRLIRLGAGLERVRSRLAGIPHWYLMALGVEPGTAFAEASAALIQPVLTEADRTGTLCYLETFDEERLESFESCGFRIAGAGRIPRGGPAFWAMTRPASRGSGSRGAQPGV